MERIYVLNPLHVPVSGESGSQRMSQQLKIVRLTPAVLIDTRHWQAACFCSVAP